MMARIQPDRFAQAAAEWGRGWLLPALLRHRAFGAAFLASLAAAFYWGIIASDRYVSEAHVVIQRTDLTGGQAMDFAAPFGGTGGARADQLLLRDYLLSVDMLRKIDARLNLRGHYSGWYRDPLSRMWFADAPLEVFHRHFLSMTSVEFDDYAGVLVIKAQGYDPQTAHALAAMLVKEGEQYMNSMAQDLAWDQVAFLERQANDMSARTIRARRAVLAYQNRKGLASPQGMADNVAAIIGRLEAQLAELQTRRTAMLGYLMPDSPNIAELNLQIGAVEKQIRQEQGRLASPNGRMLNSIVEEFQRLQMNADFAQDIYKTALDALEKGRIEATRTLKKVSVLQAPTVPQYPVEPRRIYNTVVFILVALLLAGIVQLLAAIIRDHKD